MYDECLPPLAAPLSRRLLLSSMLALPLLTMGCASAEPVMRVGSAGWPGYLLIEWAATQRYLDLAKINIVSMPSSEASMNALAAGLLEAGCLTLDEVLLLRSEGVKLKVVAVLDESVGADVLLAKPHIGNLAALRGRRIGLEETATGVLMLEAALRKVGLARQDVRVMSVLPDRQEAAYDNDNLDALVTMEPLASKLRLRGGHVLFSSADIPGQIIDVLAVRSDVLVNQPLALRGLIEGHFRALAQKESPQLQAFLSQRMHLPQTQLAQLCAGLRMVDRAANRRWLEGGSPHLLQAAQRLGRLMSQNGLLRKTPDLTDLVAAGWVAA